MATGLGKAKLVKTCWILPKNWHCVTICLWRRVGKLYLYVMKYRIRKLLSSFKSSRARKRWEKRKRWTSNKVEENWFRLESRRNRKENNKIPSNVYGNSFVSELVSISTIPPQQKSKRLFPEMNRNCLFTERCGNFFLAVCKFRLLNAATSLYVNYFKTRRCCERRVFMLLEFKLRDYSSFILCS